MCSQVPDGKGMGRTAGLTHTVISLSCINARLSLPLWYGQRHIPERSLSWLRGGGSYHHLSVGIFFPCGFILYRGQSGQDQGSGVLSPRYSF